MGKFVLPIFFFPADKLLMCFALGIYSQFGKCAREFLRGVVVYLVDGSSARLRLWNHCVARRSGQGKIKREKQRQEKSLQLK